MVENHSPNDKNSKIFKRISSKDKIIKNNEIKIKN